MKRIAALLGLLAVAAPAEVPSFWQQLSPAERLAAGLDQLTPGQRAALDQLARAFADQTARLRVEAARAAGAKDSAAAVEKVRAEEHAARAADAADELKRKLAGAGFAARDDDVIIRSKIPGRFYGWDGRTEVHLENGQVWQQANPDLKYFPDLVDPEVQLVPSARAGWTMVVVGAGASCQVRRIR